MAYAHMNQPPADKHSEYMKPRRHSSISAPLMFVIVEVALIFVMSVFFRVSDIEVIGNSHYTDSEIIRAIDIEEGTTSSSLTGSPRSAGSLRSSRM